MADPLPVPPTDAAAAWGIVAAGEAIERGQSLAHAPEQIAADAHAAAEEAYELYLHLAEHAALDDAHAATHEENQPIVGAAFARPAPRRPPPRLQPHHKRTKKPGRATVMPSPEIRARVGHGHGGGGHHGGHHEHGGFEDYGPDYEIACPPNYVPLADGTCAPWPEGATVGHGGGHHGGHHGGHGFDGVIVSDWPAWEPVVLACGPGQLLLADGTCFDPAAYGHPIEPGAHAGQVFMFDEDGYAHLPDGSAVHVEAVDFGEIASHVGQTSFPTYTEPTYPPVTGTGTMSSGNAEADALNAQWAALAQVIPVYMGANASLPMSLAPDVASSTFSGDYAGWQEFYAGIGSFGIEDLTGDLTGWQAYANAWSSYFHQQFPNVQASSLPANFPTPQGTGISSVLPSISSIESPTSNVAQIIEWGVIAVLVGVGVWLFWPALVGARGAMAAL